MKTSITIGTLIACVFLLGHAGLVGAACDPDGDVQFICGPVSPEDLISVPQSPWVIISSMENEGHLYLADTRDHTAAILPPRRHWPFPLSIKTAPAGEAGVPATIACAQSSAAGDSSVSPAGT